MPASGEHVGVGEKILNDKQGAAVMTGRTIDVDGNLTLLCAIVIGSIDEADTVTGATAATTGNGQNANFDFWG